MNSHLNFNTNTNPFPQSRFPVYGKNGMVATSQPLAANAGLEILKRGGNAIDAAVATAAALTVVEPTSNGIGGDCFAIVWMKDRMYGLNSSGPSVENISIEKVKAKGHSSMPKFGWIPVTVPGAPGGWSELVKRFGNLSLTEVLAPAVRLSEEGFPISPGVAYFWKYAHKTYKSSPYIEWFRTFSPAGRAPKAGELFALPDHANTLQEIGETNGESFYRGRLAAEIVKASKAQGGYFEREDLADYRPLWVNPISVSYQGYDVWELPPNGQGIVALMALNTLKRYEFPRSFDTEAYHLQFEAMKHAFITGKHHITDANHMRVSCEQLLSEAYGEKMRSQIGEFASKVDPEIFPSKGGTVYLATADHDGNMVSFIQSNYMGFGSGVVVPGTGIAMNNRGADFSLDEAHANALVGGKRTYHTIIPGFLTKGNKAIGPFGVMGGYMQPQGHVQVILNSIHQQLDPQRALDAPRWQWIKENSFVVESHFPTDIAKALIAKGHDVKVELESGTFGRGQIIWRDSDTGVFVGGTESRCDGYIAHY